MPKKMEEALKRQARKRGYTGKRYDAYVWGAMNKQGMLHHPKKASNWLSRLSHQ